MNIHDLLSAIIIIVVIILAAAFSATIMQSVQTSQYNATSTSNESRNFVTNNTPYALQGVGCCGSGTVVSALYNDSAHTCTYATSRYTYNDTHITIYSNGTGVCPNMTTGTHYIDYNYYDKYTSASNITGFGLTTLTNITEQTPNLGLILIVSVIIGILIGSFVVYKRRK